MVHHNAAKFTSKFCPRKGNYDNFSISKILKDLHWETLEERRRNARLTMAYKIINGQVILDPETMPKLEFQRLSRKCNESKVGYLNQLVEPPCSIEVAQKTFFFATPKLWNDSVSPLQANAPSVEAFKQHLKKK